jgi:hypothetical protein
VCSGADGNIVRDDTIVWGDRDPTEIATAHGNTKFK